MRGADDYSLGTPGVPLSGPGQRGGLILIGTLLAAAAVALTVRDSPVPVVPPVPSTADAAACTRLVAALPATLDGSGSRPATPASPLTAAWGRPPITLACGMPPVADPVAQGQVTFGGTEGNGLGVGASSGGAGLTWFEDVFDATLWTTRVRPELAVRVPAVDSFADVLGAVTATALSQRRSG